MVSAYDADPVFQANPAQLGHLLNRIHLGNLAIPDFQRDFTWEPRRTKMLLQSMMSRFPAGTFLFWSVGPENNMFGSRPVAGVQEGKESPQEFVLDGQQRLTSLYRALNAIGDERFFLVVDEFAVLPSKENPTGALRDQVNFDKAILWHPVGSRDEKALNTRSARIERGILALEEYRVFDEWLDDYAETRDGAHRKAIKVLLRDFRDQYLAPLKSYGFPVVTLPSNTRIEAVATVFETLNNTGKPLGVFELLTARFYPNDIRLRDWYESALEDHPILEEFGVDAYSILQAITLRASGSAQRADVLSKLKAEDVRDHWDVVVRGFARVLEFLQNECGVVTPKILPYGMLLVPMAAVWEEVAQAKGPEQVNILARLKQFFWCTVFMTNYDQGANSQAGADYGKLRLWLFDPAAQAPEAITDFFLSAATLRAATTRRKALYSGMLALTVMNGARDFHKGVKLTPERVKSDKIDSHHVFPKAFLASGSSALSAELALNRALIDSATNKAIGAKAPSQYFGALRETLGERELVEILSSHLLDADSDDDPFRKDDYDGFIDRRLADVITAVELATGKKVSTEVELQ
ncbi:DUF262 domain-containing protein [Kineosporia rhizophila]|uniref:GmrSD restriction endonuclease domain-containing protein n=1 Tax=Kineosporia rhizophila TaxID=84633 RepID=UPI001E5D5E2C|nr:DUF262 domain-containing protein [Kineosporia rhizophila]MCE0535859.1 DUF262 domain-containing protein [Kineosporia rhizophila]